MAPHLLLFAVEAIGLFAVVLLGSRLIVCAPDTSQRATCRAHLSQRGVRRLLAREEYAFWIPAAYELDVGALASPMNFLRNLTPGLFMLLCYSLFREGQRFPRWLLGALVVQCLLEEPVPLLLGSSAGQYDLLEVAPALLQLVFVGCGSVLDAVRVACRPGRGPAQLRKIFVAIVGTFVFAFVLGERLLIPWQSAALFETHVVLSVIGALLSTVVLWIMFRPDAAAYLDPFRSEVSASPGWSGRRRMIRTSERYSARCMSIASITTAS